MLNERCVSHALCYIYLHLGVSSLDVTGCIKIITYCIAAWLGFSILLPTPPPQFLPFLSQVSCIYPISSISAHFRREHFIVIFTSGCLKSCCSRLHYFITYCKTARLGFSNFSQFLLPNFSYFSPKYPLSPQASFIFSLLLLSGSSNSSSGDKNSNG